MTNSLTQSSTLMMNQVSVPVLDAFPQPNNNMVTLLALAVTMLTVTIVNRFRPNSWIPDSTVTVFAGLLLGLFLQVNENELGLNIFFLHFQKT